MVTSDPNPTLLATTLTGVAVSHIAHLVAALSLYSIARSVLPSNPRVAFTAACLHVFSPGGVFLSAANGESVYAALTFLGLWTYVSALRFKPLKGEVSVICPDCVLIPSAWHRQANVDSSPNESWVS